MHLDSSFMHVSCPYIDTDINLRESNDGSKLTKMYMEESFGQLFEVVL